jgi:hypothetical protein
MYIILIKNNNNDNDNNNNIPCCKLTYVYIYIHVYVDPPVNVYANVEKPLFVDDLFGGRIVWPHLC